MHYQDLFIGGRWIRPSSSEAFESIDPYAGEAWATFPDCDLQDVNNAVAAAKRAFDEDVWRRDGFLRSRLLLRLGDLLENEAPRLGAIESRDNGKTVRENVGQAKFAAQVYRYFAGLADKIDGRAIPLDVPNTIDFTVCEPYGVCALLLAWNSPLQLLANKLAPALAAGNTVIVKPSEVAPASVLEFGKLVERAGLPPGVVNIITGVGPRVGGALTEHRDVELVSLTGGVSTGRAIASIAARAPKKVILELGGKSPNVIFDDADLDLAVKGAVAGIFNAAGQTCIAGSRLLVHEDVIEEVVERLTSRARDIRLGDPADPATEMGPLASKPHMQRVLGFIDEAIKEGAKLVTGGRRLTREGLENGFFVEPTVLVDVSPSMKIACEEVFGPVLSVFRFRTEAEAIALANQSEFGLASGVWTSNLDRALNFALAMRAGTVWVNTYRSSSPAAPFGGFKRSGVGRERGKEALYEYLQVKNVMISLGGATRKAVASRH
jgi:(Z)-2-((N-methylformamido)methylene)-5-hydroxybutyrolactone dehydrogenase